jgi:hypothetical protein
MKAKPVAKTKIVPETKLGRAAVKLGMLFVALLSLYAILLAFATQPGTQSGAFLEISIPIIILLGLVSGLLSFILGLMSIIKQKERAILVYVLGFFGLLPWVFMIIAYFG